ncbi:cation diffusion facilitator family transporter [Candidatus Caldatribacterium sp. SIUC1]|uniref:cation diffusion facilitator family transporter n=1 Tax=Candidatus Caldatribacterium sp. SIUC1 TaxID=3418365 RepID=UPI003F6925BD
MSPKRDSSHHTLLSLSLGIALNTGIFVAEVVGGLLSGSLALLSDALHNLTDIFSLFTAFFALRLASRAQTPGKTYGYRRAEILAAFVNTLLLFGVAAYLVREAAERFFHPSPLWFQLALPVAVVGLLGNFGSVVLLFSSSRESLSIRSAFVHLVADTLASCVVVLGVGMAGYLGWMWLDPLVGLGVAVFVLREAFPLFGKTIHILMQGAPPRVRPEVLKKRLETVAGVENVHHLHLWSLNEREHYAEFHVVTTYGTLKEVDKLRQEIAAILREEFDIHHSTIQFECQLCGSGDLIVQE